MTFLGDLVGWTESQDASSNFTLVAAITKANGEDAYQVSGDGIFVKNGRDHLLGIAQVFETDAGGMLQISQNEFLKPHTFLSGAPDTGSEDVHSKYTWFGNDSYIQLRSSSYLYAKTYHATNEQATVLAWLGRAAQPYVGLIDYWLKCKGTTTLTADRWNDVALTAQDSLPEGRYAVVRCYAWSHIATGAGTPIAARLKFTDSVLRPGVLALYGGEDSGNFGKSPIQTQMNFWPLSEAYSFRHDDLPTAQFLSATADTEQTVLLGLVSLSGQRNIR